MADALVVQFTDITGANEARARQYLTVSDGDVEQAIQLYFESGGIDMGGAVEAQPSATTRAGSGRPEDPISLDDDDDEDMDMVNGHSVEDDEAMAKRLQEEMYGAQGAGGPEEDVRAPMARTTQTLLGPDASDFRNDDAELDRAVQEQMARRRLHRPGEHNGITI
jgi:hypothetical protein